MRFRAVILTFGIAFGVLLGGLVASAWGQGAPKQPKGGSSGVSPIYFIQGDAYDQNKKPIAGVGISTAGKKALTDSAGKFSIAVDRRTPSYVVHAGKGGVEFSPADITVTSPTRETSVTIHFRGRTATK